MKLNWRSAMSGPGAVPHAADIRREAARQEKIAKHNLKVARDSEDKARIAKAAYEADRARRTNKAVQREIK